MPFPMEFHRNFMQINQGSSNQKINQEFHWNYALEWCFKYCFIVFLLTWLSWKYQQETFLQYNKGREACVKMQCNPSSRICAEVFISVCWDGYWLLQTVRRFISSWWGINSMNMTLTNQHRSTKISQRTCCAMIRALNL